MRINKIRILNINSLKSEVLIDFQAAPLMHTGLFAIIGDTGAGKTSILDAITLALYGKVPRNKEVKDVLSYGAVDCLAELEFEHDQELYLAKWSIWRARGKRDGSIQGPKRELARWNSDRSSFEIIAEKIREVDQQVESITGLDYDRFRRSVLLAQGDFAAFLDANESERGELLERITGASIYSEISKAAFQKNKEEQEKLKELDHSIKALSILLPEEVERLKGAEKDQQQAAQQAEKALQSIDQSIQKWSDLESVNAQIQAYQSALAQIKSETEQENTSFDRLNKHLQLRPHLAAYYAIEKLQQDQTADQLLFENWGKQLLSLREEKTSNQTHLDSSQKKLELLKVDIDELEPKWEEVKRLDIQVQEKEKPLQEITQNLSKIKFEVNASNNILKEKRADQSQKQKRFNALEVWLKEKSYLDSLPEKISYIQEKVNQLLSLENRLAERKEEMSEVNNKTIEKTDQHKKLEIDLANIQKKYQEAEASFQKLSPKEFTLDRVELLEQLDQKLEQQKGQLNQLTEAIKVQSAYEDLLGKYNQENEELLYLYREEQFLNNSILNNLDILSEIEGEREYKRNIFEQQQLIANYEKDRTNLKEGDPCPLCLSTDHPFRSQEVKPYVDRAKQEFDGVSQVLEQRKKTYASLLTKQNELSQAVGEKRVRAEGFQSQLKVLEQELASLFSDFNFLDLNRLSENKFAKQTLLSYQENIQEERLKRDQLKNLHRNLQDLEKQVLFLQNQVNETSQELKWLAKQKEQLNKELKELEAQRNTIGKELSAIGTSYQLAFNLEKAKSWLQELNTTQENFKQQKQNVEQLNKELKELDFQIQSIEHKLSSLQKDLDKIQTSQYSLNEELSKLRAKRTGILGDKDPITEKKKYQEQFQLLDTERSQQEKELLSLEEKIKNLLTNQTNTEAKLKTNQDKKAKAEQSLLKNLESIGIFSLVEMQQAILEPAQEKRIQARKQALETEKVRLTGLLEVQEKQTLVLQKDLSEQLDPANLQKERETINAQYQDHLHQLGAIREQLKQNTQREQEQKERLDKRQKQHQECLRWASLNELIGSADGKKFRTFAQGLTLERLTQIANQHLQALNGRYLLSKLTHQDLGIEIIDTFQANNKRSIHTLSGGEKFLVSLALALGLSDLASKNAQIGSLFIDEGFGTLDESSLDLAISTLENLQASGKTIGIISHVKELKERIGIQIQVKKQSDGFSKVEVIAI